MIPVVLGTRGSPLAVAQTRLVMAAMKKAWPARNFEIHIIKTQGDRLSEDPSMAGQDLGKGLFTAELERGLIDKKIDIAVHSLKDLPTELVEGLIVAGVPKRADARDMLITRGPTSLRALPDQARVATGSPRRAAQLTLMRPDLRVEDVRGNIDTRLRKFRENEGWSALILAVAGLERLKLDVSGLVVTPIPFEEMLPAPGQGALGLQTRIDAEKTIDLVHAVHDMPTAAAVVAERMFLHALGGGCQEPIGAYAELAPDNFLQIRGVAWLFGETTVRKASLRARIEQAEELGVELAVEISR